MAKRFTDTDKYKKPFIRGLQGAYKLLWDYIYHDCNHAGIWIVDFEVAQIYVGSDMPINKKDAFKYFNENETKILEINNGSKWFIIPFIDFQYGNLSENNRAHLSVIRILNKYKLLKDNKPITRPLHRAKDKDKDKSMDKDKDKRVVKIPFTSKIFYDTWNLWKEYKIEQFNFIYKTIGEQSALNKLVKLANGFETNAIDIINYSMAQGYRGLFKEDKRNSNGQQDNQTQRIADKFSGKS